MTEADLSNTPVSAGLAGDVAISFVDITGSASRALRKTMGEVFAMWDVGEVNGLALPMSKVAAIEALAHSGLSNRKIAVRVGVSHTSVAKVLRGDHDRLRDGKWRVRRMRVRVFDEVSREFGVGHIRSIVDAGPRPTYQLTTSSGHELTMSGDQRILTGDGWLPLLDTTYVQHHRRCTPENLFVFANGRPVYRDYHWMAARRAEGLSVAEIATEAGVSYHTIRKWLKEHRLQYPDDQRNFQPGHTPWNAGVTGYTHRPHVISDSGRERLKAARSGSRSNFWRGGVTSERASIGAWTTSKAAMVHARFAYTCQCCSQVGGRLHAHHVIPVWFAPERARDFDNLISVCSPCHREIHSSVEEELAFASIYADSPLPPVIDRPSPRGNRLTAHAVQVVSITYKGIQQTYALELEEPDRSFVANGLVVSGIDASR